MENTKAKEFGFAAEEDHLHIRGEYVTVLNDDLVTYRITSTYVENTFLVVVWIIRIRDHLHIRGEYSKQIPL